MPDTSDDNRPMSRDRERALVFTCRYCHKPIRLEDPPLWAATEPNNDGSRLYCRRGEPGARWHVPDSRPLVSGPVCESYARRGSCGHESCSVIRILASLAERDTRELGETLARMKARAAEHELAEQEGD
jgi:hypothetical protein